MEPHFVEAVIVPHSDVFRSTERVQKLDKFKSIGGSFKPAAREKSTIPTTEASLDDPIM